PRCRRPAQLGVLPRAAGRHRLHAPGPRAGRCPQRGNVPANVVACPDRTRAGYVRRGLDRGVPRDRPHAAGDPHRADDPLRPFGRLSRPGLPRQQTARQPRPHREGHRVHRQLIRRGADDRHVSASTISLEIGPDDFDQGRETDMKKSGAQKSESPSRLIDARIKELGDWRGKMLSRLRTLVKEADPEVVEEWKWRGVPVWSHDGLICTGETYKNVVKMTFAKGAALKDPSRLFNSSLDGNTRRAIDFHEGGKIDEEALKTLVRAAVTLNKSRAQR